MVGVDRFLSFHSAKWKEWLLEFRPLIPLQNPTLVTLTYFVITDILCRRERERENAACKLCVGAKFKKKSLGPIIPNGRWADCWTCYETKRCASRHLLPPFRLGFLWQKDEEDKESVTLCGQWMVRDNPSDRLRCLVVDERRASIGSSR